jgi:SH3-like domain-containing protein
VVAQLQPGVSASVRKCTGKWCQIVGAGFDGWIAQERLWGVYPNETVP